MKNALWILVAIVVIGGLAWWGMNQNAPVAHEGPYKVGAILPMTGDAAAYGEPLSKVLRIAVDEINAAGGVNGQPIELIVEDGKCNGQDAASAAQKLANVDGVEVIIGGFCSSESLAAIPVAEGAKVAMISASASSPKLTGISPYFVRNYPSDSAQGAVLAEIAYNDKGWKNVAVIQEQTDYAQGVYEAFKAKFEELGGTVTNEPFPTETSDFRSLVSKVKAKNADAVFLSPQTPAVAARIMTQMKQLNWKPSLMVADVVPGDPSTVSEYKDILEGALGAEFGVDRTNAKFNAMVAAYKAQNGDEPPYQGYAQTVYDSAFIVRDALMAVGYDGEKLAKWLRTEVKGWEGAAGLVTIGANGDPETGHRPEVIMGGEVKPYVK